MNAHQFKRIKSPQISCRISVTQGLEQLQHQKVGKKSILPLIQFLPQLILQVFTGGRKGNTGGHGWSEKGELMAMFLFYPPRFIISNFSLRFILHLTSATIISINLVFFCPSLPNQSPQKPYKRKSVQICPDRFIFYRFYYFITAWTSSRVPN